MAKPTRKPETNADVLVQLDIEQVATILAALRLFQRKYELRHAEAIRKDWPEHFDNIKPLGTEDIDTLCENINCAPNA